MDAETIKREALDAILDLALDLTVRDVTHNGHNWCVHFAGDYGQFCDSFQNQFERDNSPRVIREKIKKHLLGQVTQLRNKGGRRATKKGFDDEGAPNVTELFQEAIAQTTSVIGEAIDRTFGLTSAGIKAAGDVAETIGTGTAEMIRPEVRRAPARPSAAGHATREGAPRKAVRQAERDGATKKAGAKTKGATKSKRASGKKKVAAKKAGAKKSSRKR
jgi:hypothetical protein